MFLAVHQHPLKHSAGHISPPNPGLLLNQPNFPIPLPALQPFLANNSIVDPQMMLDINKPINRIVLHKFGASTVPMFPHPPRQISSHANVQRAPIPTCQYGNPTSPFHPIPLTVVPAKAGTPMPYARAELKKSWVPAFAGTTDVCLDTSECWTNDRDGGGSVCYQCDPTNLRRSVIRSARWATSVFGST